MGEGVGDVILNYQIVDEDGDKSECIEDGISDVEMTDKKLLINRIINGVNQLTTWDIDNENVVWMFLLNDNFVEIKRLI